MPPGASRRRRRSYSVRDVESRDVTSGDYTRRLIEHQTAWWKRLLPVQAPYRWNLRRLDLGSTLDLGCGIGRNLQALDRSVGIDYDAGSVAYCRDLGLDVYLPDDFAASTKNRAGAFDSLLLSHVAEHMTGDDLRDFVRSYLACIRPGGKVVVICPQERGYATDASHQEFVDFEVTRQLADDLGLLVERQYSFPFPRRMGTLFVYNEFVTVATVPQPGSS